MSGKIYLLSEKKNRYKANLHCHSTVSDGCYTPEQLKRIYKERGYAILAITDHEVLVPHNELNDTDFLTLPGYELQTFGDKHLPKLMRRVNHMNLYPRDPNNKKLPFFNISDVMQLDKPPDISKAEYSGPQLEKEYSVKGLNRLIAMAREAGFIVSYNHPTWSKEDAGIYTNLEGIFAMEIYNSGCEQSGYDTYCPWIYEEMLRSGQHIGCVASDDTHKAEDLFGGFTVIYADKLEHRQIISALEEGDYYASRGPEINALWYEDGIFHIESSPAKRIIVSNSGRRKESISLRTAEKGLIDGGEFPIDDTDLYVRFTVQDEMGRTANTRAYWREEFESSPASIADICRRKIAVG